MLPSTNVQGFCILISRKCIEWENHLLCHFSIKEGYCSYKRHKNWLWDRNYCFRCLMCCGTPSLGDSESRAAPQTCWHFPNVEGKLTPRPQLAKTAGLSVCLKHSNITKARNTCRNGLPLLMQIWLVGIGGYTCHWSWGWKTVLLSLSHGKDW